MLLHSTSSLRHFSRLLLAIALTFIASACSKKDSFVVRGQFADGGARSVVATYFADGGLKRISAPMVDDKFTLVGASARPTLLTVALADGTMLATLVVENGDKIKLTGHIDDPSQLQASGNSASSAIARWCADNATILLNGNADAINSSIASFIADNPSSLASTALLVSYFRTQGHELIADSLFSLIKPEARPAPVVQNFNAILAAQLASLSEVDVKPLSLYEARDSAMTFFPRRYNTSLLAFVPPVKRSRDSITPILRTLSNNHPEIRFRAVELSSYPDSATWKNAIKADTAVSWYRTWAPAHLATNSLRPLSIPSLPYFIVLDSAGTQILRTTSITQAAQLVDSRMQRFASSPNP